MSGRDETDVAARLADVLRSRWVFRGDAHADELAAALLPVVRELQADAVRPFAELFSGGPDTPCRTTWRDPLGGRAAEVRTTECVEVPMDDLRDAFARAAALRGEVDQ